MLTYNPVLAIDVVEYHGIAGVYIEYVGIEHIVANINGVSVKGALR
jgi:hypothetical protein